MYMCIYLCSDVYKFVVFICIYIFVYVFMYLYLFFIKPAPLRCVILHAMNSFISLFFVMY